MSILKTTCFTIASAAILTLPTAAYANSNGANGTRTAAIGSQSSLNAVRSHGGHSPVILLGGSETATFYYRRGVRHFEKGNLEKSEDAFRAVLRADGSKSMDGLSLHYLTLISDKQGDDVRKLHYAEAYFDLKKK